MGKFLRLCHKISFNHTLNFLYTIKSISLRSATCLLFFFVPLLYREFCMTHRALHRAIIYFNKHYGLNQILIDTFLDQTKLFLIKRENENLSRKILTLRCIEICRSMKFLSANDTPW